MIMADNSYKGHMSCSVKARESKCVSVGCCAESDQKMIAKEKKWDEVFRTPDKLAAKPKIRSPSPEEKEKEELDEFFNGVQRAVSPAVA